MEKSFQETESFDPIESDPAIASLETKPNRDPTNGCRFVLGIALVSALGLAAFAQYHASYPGGYANRPGGCANQRKQKAVVGERQSSGPGSVSSGLTSSGGESQSVRLKEAPRIVSAEEVEELATKLDRAMSAGSWDEASNQLLALAEVAPTHAAIAPARSRIDAVKLESQRIASVDEGIAMGRRVDRACRDCNTPNAIKEIWERVRQVKRTDRQYSQAKKVVAMLERCRKKVAARLVASLRESKMTQRITFADRLDTTWLKGGYDVRIRLQGQYKEYIRISWPLIDRAVVYQFTEDGGFIAECTRLGFKKLVFSNGWNESYSYEFEPSNDCEVCNTAMGPMGLAYVLGL